MKGPPFLACMLASSHLGGGWAVSDSFAVGSVRVTDFVEVMLPIMQVRVLHHIFNGLYRPRAATDWGLDLVWCKYVQQQFGSERACVVVNAGAFSHPDGSMTAHFSRRSGLEASDCVDFGLQSDLCMYHVHAHMWDVFGMRCVCTWLESVLCVVMGAMRSRYGTGRIACDESRSVE